MYSANQNHVLLMGDTGRIELEPATRYSGNHMWTGKDGRERELEDPGCIAPALNRAKVAMGFKPCRIVGADDMGRDDGWPEPPHAA